MMVPRLAPDPRASATGDPQLDKLHTRGQNKAIVGDKRNSLIVKTIEKKLKKKKKGPPPTPGQGQILPTGALLPTGGPANGPPPTMSGSGY